MRERARDMIVTTMVADGLAWQNLYRRSRLLPDWTRRKRREFEADAEARGILDDALPFALSLPTAPFASGPGVNSEWLAFQLRILAENGGRYDRAVALQAWDELVAKRSSLRVTIGQHATLLNLEAGVEPPISGHDNPHYFDDSACFRAIALVLADGPDVFTSVRSDAEISNAEDGLWAAEAFAVALRTALDGGGVDDAIARGRERIPAQSWLARDLERALAVAAGASSVFELIASLSDESTNHAYNYGDSAPETLSIALAIVTSTRGRWEPGLLAALALPTTAASVAPMVGALCGALGTAAPSGVADPGPLRGIALPHLAGARPLELLEPLFFPTD